MSGVELESKAKRTSSVFDYNTPLNKVHLLQYRLNEEKSMLLGQKKLLEEKRKSLYEKMGKPNAKNLRHWRGREHKHKHHRSLLKFFETGDEINQINTRVKEICKDIDKQMPFTFQDMFIRVAEQLLLKEDFERVMKYTNYRHKELLNMLEATPDVN